MQTVYQCGLHFLSEKYKTVLLFKEAYAMMELGGCGVSGENICKYVSFEPAPDVINTVHFVLETEPQNADSFRIDALYKAYCVTAGEGFLHTTAGKLPLAPGDVFFTFPSVPYAIESGEEFQYFYISYLGVRAYMLLDRIGICAGHSYFPGCPEILETWKQFFFLADEKNLDMISESTLLYTLSAIEKRTAAEETKDQESIVPKIKKMIDDELQNPALSLELLSRECAYHKNYISSVFKRDMHMTVRQYINTVRIQNACALMEKNVTCMKDISALCGFSDPLYFSKVFKRLVGVSPKEFLKGLQ